MGRSFDRGGRSRKERERGKRRAYLQAERDKEARADVLRAKRMAPGPVLVQSERLRPVPAASAVHEQTAVQKTPAVAVKAKRPGFFSQVIGRLFKKSA